MSISTPADLILQAFKRSGIIGVGQTPSAEDMNDGFDALNGMIAQWNRKRWLLWALDDIACTSTGAQSYTIGNGSQFDTPRPDRIEYAYSRLLPTMAGQTLDTPLFIIQSHEDYARIVMKALTTWPTSIFYDSQFPVGLLRVWPLPTAEQYEIHVLVKNQIVPFTSITEVISDSVPPEVFEALSWNLCARLRPSYGLPEDPQVVNLAKIALGTLRQANLQIPTLQTPYGYPRRGSFGYGYTLGISGGFA
jgi:hypothetical protein